MAKLEDLIKQIPDARLRAEIAREAAALKSTKKFGLVFEEHIPEQVQLPGLPVRVGSRVVKRGNGKQVFQVLEIQGNSARLIPEPEGQEESAKLDELVIVKKFGEPIYPTLTPRERIERAPDKTWHTIINADNYHALQLLLYCYEGMIDVIYIDPPYNTGARDWKYNNDYVDSKDEYRHSKWLAMMKRRLLLARRLLRSDGVLIITIDDDENRHLQMLLEDVIPERGVTPVIIVHNPRGNVSNNFARTHEYALFAITKGLSIIERTRTANVNPRKLRRWGHNSTREARPTMFYPIYVRNNEITRIGIVPADDFHPQSKNILLENSEIEIWPIDQNGIERRWNFGLDTIPDELDRIIVRPDKDGHLDLFLSEEDKISKTVWTGGDLEAGKNGASLVKNILGKEFPFPKSLYAVKYCIELVTGNRPNALILDFFAGSGTTLNATSLLNSEDGGKRRCILVTNNEVKEKLAKELNGQGIFAGQDEFEQYGICESITWPRNKYVVNGKRDDGTELAGTYLNGREMKEGFEENIEYFRLDFLDLHEVAYGEKFEAILPILWLMSGAQGKRESDKGEKAWFIPKNSPFAVLIDEHAFSQFKQAIAKRTDLTHIFLVTDSMEAYRSMLAQLPDTLKTKMLYKSYLDNFRINTEQNI